MRIRRKGRMVALMGVAALLLAACGGGGTGPAPEEGADGGELTTVRAGWVSAIDQLGLVAAVEQGFFEEHGLNVEVAEPFPTGVDMLNAVDAGEIDIAQVGVPAIGAILEGMDLTVFGNYTGSSTQLGIDETMAMVAREQSGIDPDNLKTLQGKKIGVSVGSINHLYLLGVLEEVGVSADSVEIVNTPPPEMAVALETGGLDAAVIWDPWPVVATQQVAGAYEVMRGGGYIAFIGYLTGLNEWVSSNEETVTAFLAARAQADQWIRENPDEAAELATRWIPGTELDVATEAMQYNVKQLDARISACNYLALYQAQEQLNEVGAIEDTFPVGERMNPTYILQAQEQNPEYFEDLPPIPEGAEVSDGFQFDPAAAAEVCK